MLIKRKSEQFDLQVPKFLITDAFKIIKQIPLEISMDIIKYYNRVLCQYENSCFSNNFCKHLMPLHLDSPLLTTIATKCSMGFR